MNWIKVEDQVPPFDEAILLYEHRKEFDFYYIGRLHLKTKTGSSTTYEFKDEDWNAISVTHWAKLTPPKS